MILHVLDQNFKLVGVVDDYISLIWRPAYYDIGDFELYLNASSEAVNLLKKDYYLVRDVDITVDSVGNTTYTKVMIVNNFILTTNIDEGDKFIYSGKELKSILNKRIVWQQTNLNCTAESGIRQLVNENAINPTDANRVIPALTLGASAGLNDAIEKQITGTKLDQSIIDICQTYNYGWEIYIYNHSMVLIVYQGVDRSYNQLERPYVVFSDEFDNIINSEYQFDSSNYSNTALVGGEGEGVQRKYITIGAENTGLDRCEIFTDARDLSSNAGTPQEISPDAYLALLTERGRDSLATYSITEAFTGEVVTDGSFTYGVDFYLGDTVTVVNRYGIAKDVMILSAIESVDDTGVKLVPQFGI